jgi:L-threonylcarbamoyladenylate synthase
MQNEVQNVLKTLKEGGLVLYPTDTVWGIGCDASNPEAVEKIYKIKKRHDSKALICLVADSEMLRKYVKKIPESAFDIFKVPEKPTTIIYDGAQNLAENLIAKDGTIAIRIPNDEFCFQLLQEFKSAIVSTSANISGEPTPKSFKEITEGILKGVDYIVNLRHDKIMAKPSSIIKLSSDGKVKIIRN